MISSWLWTKNITGVVKVTNKTNDYDRNKAADREAFIDISLLDNMCLMCIHIKIVIYQSQIKLSNGEQSNLHIYLTTDE